MARPLWPGYRGAGRAVEALLPLMYARHFDLTQDPFSIAPDPRFLFMSDRYREVLAHLLFGITGTGKTTVCRCFLEQIPAACKVAIVFNPKLSVMELPQTICEEFHAAVNATHGSISPKSYVDALKVFLIDAKSRRRAQQCADH